jgi:hypothetical protein
VRLSIDRDAFGSRQFYNAPSPDFGQMKSTFNGMAVDVGYSAPS